MRPWIAIVCMTFIPIVCAIFAGYSFYCGWVWDGLAMLVIALLAVAVGFVIPKDQPEALDDADRD